MSTEQQISIFIDKLIQENQLTDLNIIESAKLEIASTLQEFIILKLTDSLKQQEREELFDLIEAFPRTFNSHDYFKEKFVDYEDRLTILLSEFRKIYFQNNS